MKVKCNKGIIGVDIGVAILVFVMFVGIITMLFYNGSMATISIERRATATDIAVKVIENIQIMEYEDFISKIDTDEIKSGIEIPEGYTVKVESSLAVEGENNPDLLREVTVRVLYNFKDKTEKVEIKTLKSYM